jgi:hypothetical protein
MVSLGEQIQRIQGRMAGPGGAGSTVAPPPQSGAAGVPAEGARQAIPGHPGRRRAVQGRQVDPGAVMAQPGIGQDVSHLMDGAPGVGADVSDLMPPVGADVSHLMGTPAPTFRSSNARDAAGNPIVDFASGVWQNVNPFAAMQSLGKALIPQALARHIGATEKEVGSYGPGNLAKGVLAAQNKVKAEADEAWKNGDHVTAVRKYFDWLIPIVGPALDEAADNAASGHLAKGAGQAVGLGLALGGPKALETASVKVPAIAKNANPIEEAAVDYGRANGVPIDAATATGNRFVRNVQAATANTPLGSVPAARGQAAQAAALERVGRSLADQTLPRAATAETAGARITDALQQKIEAHAQFADHAYQQLEQLVNDPKHAMAVPTGMTPTGVPIIQTMAAPVDLRGARAQLKPLYDSIARAMPVTQRQASAGFQALENIVTGPNFAPLLQTERDLGALKAIARGADLPELRSVSQGLGAQGVRALQNAVDATANKIGPAAIRSLQQGRGATAEKFATANVWETVNAEPVKAYREATAPNDAGIDHLRAIQKQVPQAIPIIARAWVDQQLERATSEGAFDHAQRLQAEWQKLGPQTKKALFPYNGQIPALDSYFRLGRMIAANPNPSGTALVGTSLASLQGLLLAPVPTVAANASSWAISAILHNAKAVQAFTKGTRLVLGPGKASRAAMSAGIADVIRAAREAGVVAPATNPVDTDPSRQAGSR